MANRVALVFCVHHKPWLMMSTLITTLVQDYQNVDLHFVYNVDRRAGIKRSQPYENVQLSPFDDRVREVCGLRRANLFEHEYENDDALDSGAWYKFIRAGEWKRYDAVLFVGEGTLLARPHLVSAMLELAGRKGAHVVASGHEKRRLPKRLFLNYKEREPNPTERDRFEDRMIRETFDIFCRDPEFRRLFDAWPLDCEPVNENHVPAGGPPGPLRRRLHSRLLRLNGNSTQHGIGSWPFFFDYVRARSRLYLPKGRGSRGEQVFVNGVTKPADSAETVRIDDVGFHRSQPPEWFGCATNHFMSRTFLERFSAKLDAFRIYDALCLPFAGTALEVIWGFVPSWLGFEKWFTDGIHRVRKDFVTYRREDSPAEMAGYINRYYAGDLAIAWHDDYLQVRGFRQDLSRLKSELPSLYF